MNHPAITAVVLTLAASHALAHDAVSAAGDNAARTISFPDTAAYRTVIVDLHTHSVFSDGHVWPNVRVAEAQRDGLDGHRDHRAPRVAAAPRTPAPRGPQRRLSGKRRMPRTAATCSSSTAPRSPATRRPAT